MRLFQPRKQSYCYGLSAIDTAVTPSFASTIFCHPEARRIFYRKILHCVQNDNCRFFPLLGLASAHRRRGGSYLFLDKKVTKNQGLELISDKFVKAFLVASTSPR